VRGLRLYVMGGGSDKQMPGSENMERRLQLEISEADFACRFDHTNLQPDATVADIELLCKEAKEHGFFAVCINPCYVPLARGLLFGYPVKVCTVVGFPLGANARSTKLVETEVALSDKADEIDVVMNIGWV
jgi:deoxyribose-phosphate aldolase